MTTLAVQKCCFVPVVKNSAPTVGTPAKCVGEGVLGGCPGAVPAAGAADRDVAAAIRAGVQNLMADCCAGRLTTRTTAPPGRGAPAAAVVAPAAVPVPAIVRASTDATAAQPLSDLAWRFITPRSYPDFRGVAQAAGMAPALSGSCG